MINANNPTGGKMVGSFNAARFDLKVNRYVTSISDTTALYRGDAVKTTGTSAVDGTPVCTKALAGETIRGFVVSIQPLHNDENFEYRKASTERTILVCDDPYIMVEIQTNGTLAVTDIGKYANIVLNGGNDITGLSGTMVDLSSTSTDSRQLRIVSLVDRVDNEVGQYAKVRCVIHDHELAHGITGSQENIWKRVGTTISPFNAGDDVNLGTGDVTIGGKLTVVGLIDPTGLILDPQAAPPSTVDGTSYYDSGSNTFQFRENGVWHSLGETSLWKRVGTELTPFNADDDVDMKKGKIITGDGTDTTYTLAEYNNASTTKPVLKWGTAIAGIPTYEGLHLEIQESGKAVSLHIESHTAAAYKILSTRNASYTVQEYIGYLSTGNLQSGTRKAWSKQYESTSSDLIFQSINDAVLTNRFILNFSTGIPTFPALNTAFGIVQTNGSGVFSSSITLPDGTLATTQSPLDNSTKLATTAYVDAAVVVENLWDRVTGSPNYVKPHNDGDSVYAYYDVGGWFSINPTETRIDLKVGGDITELHLNPDTVDTDVSIWGTSSSQPVFFLDADANAIAINTGSILAGFDVTVSGSVYVGGGIGSTASRISKGWFTNLEITNMPTVGGTSINANAVLDLTAGEVTQLANIGATTISAAQWVYLGDLNQSLATTDTPTFAQLTVDNLRLDGNTLSSSSGNINITPDNPSDHIIINSHWDFDGKTLVAISDSDTTFTAYAGKNITIEGVTFDGGVVADITNLTVSNIGLTGNTINTSSGDLNLNSFSNDIFMPNVSVSSLTSIGSILLQAGQFVSITTVNAATYDLLITDYIVNVTYTSTGAVTSLTLPTAQTTIGRVIHVKDAAGNATTNTITIDTEGSEKIDGEDTFVISVNYNSVSFYTDGSHWFKF